MPPPEGSVRTPDRLTTPVRTGTAPAVAGGLRENDGVDVKRGSALARLGTALNVARAILGAG